MNKNRATCLACNGVVDLAYVSEQARAGHIGEQMTSIVAEGDHNRLYLSATNEQVDAAKNAVPQWKPVQSASVEGNVLRPRRYGTTHWHQLFTNRQLTALTTLSDLLPGVRNTIEQHGGDPTYANAVATYLAFAIDRTADSGCSYATWQNVGDFVAHVFSRQRIAMVWDFAEANPFSSSTQNWMAQIEWIAKAVETLPGDLNAGLALQADAATTIHAETGPVIVTDPPYYDNIDYADLSDFFYVWLRPLLRDIYPDLFASILTPKDEEMTVVPSRFETPRQRFEDLLMRCLQLIRERCSPEFPSSVFYAYKQQEELRGGVTSTGWETMLTAMVSAGFQIVGTWPMRTERSARSNALSANTLASSVILVCRSRPENAPVASRSDFITALEREMPTKLDQLTREAHIAPVDLRQAAIGLGMAVYSRYRNVETLSGETVRVRQALMAINDTVDVYFREQAGELDAESRFCLDWLHAYPSGRGNYGTAENLARAYDLTIDDRLEQTHRLLDASQGQVSLYDIDAYDEERNYPSREELTAWESCLRMAYQMQTGEDRQGVAGCVRIARRVGNRLDSVERMARILYDHHNSRNDSQRAVAFNNVVTAWPEIMREMNRPETPQLVARIPLQRDE